MSLLWMQCGTSSKALKCIENRTKELVDTIEYNTIRSSLLEYVRQLPVDSSNRIDLAIGENVLFSKQRNRALVISLSIYKKPNGNLFGYGTVYYAFANPSGKWEFSRKNTPNFMLSINESPEDYRLDTRELEEYILRRLISDGLIAEDGCSLNQNYFPAAEDL